MSSLITASSSISFLLLLCSILCSELTNAEPFQSLIQLPQLSPVGKEISSGNVVSVNDFGAKGDAVTDDTQAFKKAWEIACLRSPSVLRIPAGKVYLVRPIDFSGPCHSKVTVSISGTITAPEDPKVWDGLNPRKWLYFHGVNDLIVEGGGVINGTGEKWWAQSCKIDITNPCRSAPTAITFHKSKRLKVRNLTMLNSQQMHMAFTNCFRVTLSHLKVIAPAKSPNTDGIHISASTRVVVKDSIIETGDDCISIVNYSSRVKIKNIICGPGHGISIGSLGKGHSKSQVNNVLVDGVFLSNTENGLRIKTWQGGTGSVQGIVFRNVLMDNVSNPIIIDQYYCDSSLSCLNQTCCIKVDGVSFIGIKGTSATVEAIRFACSDSCSCDNILLDNVELFLYSGEAAEAYCWNAFGFSIGRVSPYPCFPLSENLIIDQKVISSNTSHSSER